MNRIGFYLITCAAISTLAASTARAQREPHIGYIYPAGGRQDTTFEITIGGQFLDGASGVLVSAGSPGFGRDESQAADASGVVSDSGVQATVIKHDKPLTPQQVNQLRQKLQEVQKRVQTQRRNKPYRTPFAARQSFNQIAKELGVTAEDLDALAELRKKMTDPKRQPNPQIEETVTLEVTLAADAEPGPREVRLITSAGLTNPLRFHVGPLPEYCESEPNDQTADSGISEPLPVVINGQILPGDVDRFAFPARQGQRLVAAASARELIPYLADAVPGWFQATLVLYDSAGNEVAYADDYRFDPDPVLSFEVPEDGLYVLEIRDAVYRGREDFVYRITLGEIPFVTGVFPLGGRAGQETTVQLAGWNLPEDRLTLQPADSGTGVQTISIRDEGFQSNRVPFAIDTLPESFEQEPNDDRPQAQRLAVAEIVNGRIDRPGDWDIFRFEAREGLHVVAEVFARRLSSPLDSVLELTNESGRQIAVNDDCEDKGAGLITHHADSRLCVTIPEDGTYYLRLGDTQHQGGSPFAYRLHVGPQRPDFQLRVVPSSINVRAGSTVPITVYALRRDGFDEDILLEWKDAPPGFRLSGGWVPGNQDQVRLTLSVPAGAQDEPLSLHLQGRAVIQGMEVIRPAIPAEDMMQAFIYRHLVPAQDLLVAVSPAGRARAPLRLVEQQPVKISVGGTGQARFFLPGAPFFGQVKLGLSDPPEGIAIRDVSFGREGIAVEFAADAEKTRPELKGNLIVEAYTERTFNNNTRRIPIGFLPAVPFEIVPR